MLKKNPIVVLVGTGNLGIRYLQGLLMSNLEISIIAYDISLLSIKKAKNFCKGLINKKTQLDFTTNFNNLPKTIDLLILSNTADSRLDLIYKFANERHFHINSWIIEKLLSQSLNDLNKMKRIFENRNNVWVSHPRRVMKWYKDIRSSVTFDKKIKFEVSGYNWGLACNAVHFFDLFDWWLNSKLTFLEFNDLGSKWFKSKRKNFIEINGMFNGKYSCGSEVTILSDNKNRDFKINILSEGNNWVLDYKSNKFIGPNGKLIYGKDMLMSELIGPLVNDIIVNNSCSLTNFNDSADYYEKILSCLIDHWHKTTNSNSNKIPIT